MNHPQHNHEHKHKEHEHHHKAGWKPHRDWRVWIVAAMVIAMVVYVLTHDESMWPGGGGRRVPAAPAAP